MLLFSRPSLLSWPLQLLSTFLADATSLYFLGVASSWSFGWQYCDWMLVLYLNLSSSILHLLPDVFMYLLFVRLSLLVIAWLNSSHFNGLFYFINWHLYLSRGLGADMSLYYGCFNYIKGTCWLEHCYKRRIMRTIRPTSLLAHEDTTFAFIFLPLALFLWIFSACNVPFLCQLLYYIFVYHLRYHLFFSLYTVGPRFWGF